MERTLSRSSTFHQALVDFAAKVRELTTQAVDGRSYVLVEELRIWMRETSRSKLEDKFVTNTELLANAAYYDKDDGFLPFVPSTLYAGRDRCLTVFIILLDLGLGHLIHIFLKKDIIDGRLPEDLTNLTRKLREGLEDAEQVAESFNKRQWKFCPAIFSWNMEKEFLENRIVPICRKSRLGSGGTADVWQIVVQSEFVDRDIKNILENDEDASYEDKDFGHCYIFALKTFQEGHFQYYYDEKAAFDGLRSNRGVIKRLGCYSHRVISPCTARNGHTTGDSQSMEVTDTMNLFLEYGTYDLRLVFGHRSPPVFPKEILAFWEALFEVAEAVKGIHEFKAGGREFNGWHADIKPDNIIYVREKFKLADPGFSRFKKKAQGKSVPPQIRLSGGTDTYGAPEVATQLTVHQTIDTWSLGCVFSMAATWVILGYQGVCQYQQVREKALGGLLKAATKDTHPLLLSQRLKANTKPEKLDCFHNGTGVLDEVTGWHHLLKKSARKTDPITEEVLHLIDQRMLLQGPEERIDSKSLCEELQRIVRSSMKAFNDSKITETPEVRDRREHMECLLYEIEKESAAGTVEQAQPEPAPTPTKGLPANRDALKVQMEHVPLKKTSHRFETIPGHRPKATIPKTTVGGPSIVSSDTMGVKEVLYRPQTQSESPFMSAAGKRKSFRQSTIDQSSRTNTAITDLNPKTAKGPPCENAVQARESIVRDLRKKSKMSLTKKKLSKNEVLSQHFKDRDIKFIVDDAVTMLDHWDEATWLLETLVMTAHDQDPDGPDLTFTNTKSIELKKEKDSTKFRLAMRDARPKREHKAHTNINKALEPIFLNYLSMVRRTSDKSEVNALTIIILTDGLWVGMNDKYSVMGKIVDFYRMVEEDMQRLVKDRQVSIEFIQFGDNKEAQERLRRLDDDMPYLHNVGDIIDYEQFAITGNIYKMLLGSFIEEYDAINDDDEWDHLSPVDDELSPTQAAGPSLVKTKSLRTISEEPKSYTLQSDPTSTYNYGAQQAYAPPTPQQTPKKSSRFSRFISEKF